MPLVWALVAGSSYAQQSPPALETLVLTFSPSAALSAGGTAAVPRDKAQKEECTHEWDCICDHCLECDVPDVEPLRPAGPEQYVLVAGLALKFGFGLMLKDLGKMLCSAGDKLTELPHAAEGRSTGHTAAGGDSSPLTSLKLEPRGKAQNLCSGGCVYIGTDESVEIIDATTLETLHSIPVPITATEGIKSLAVAPNGSLVAAALNRNHDGTLPLPLHKGKVLLVDPAAGSILEQIDFPDPAFPSSMVFTSDGKTLYVLNRANFTTSEEPSRLYVVDVASHAITRTIPLPVPGAGMDLALTPDDAILFISVVRTDERGAKYNELYPLDTRTATFNGGIRLPGFRPGPIAMNPSGTRIYAPAHGRTIAVVDTATSQISEIPGVVAGTNDPYGAVLSMSGRYLLVSERSQPNVTIIDTVAGTIAGTIETDSRVSGPVVVLR